MLSPLLLFIAAWIRIDSPGPIFYAGVRVGRKGVPFRANEVPNSTRRQIFLTDPNNVLIELNFDVANEKPSH